MAPKNRKQKKIAKVEVKDEKDLKMEVSDNEAVEETETETVEKPRKKRWTNRTRVLVFSSRGVTYRLRHLMNDMRTMLPHSKSETKLEKKERLSAINDICEMRNCQVAVYFEMKKGQDAYMWISKVPDGPSVKFSLENGNFLT